MHKVMNELIENFAMLPYRYDDGGRATSGCRKSNKDCIVRAVSIYKGLPYNNVHAIALEWGIIDGKCYLDIGQANGHYNKRIKKASAVMEKMFANAFGLQWVKSDPRGKLERWYRLCVGDLPLNCIARMRRHVVAIRDGVVHDTWDCTNRYVIEDDWGNMKIKHRAVYGYWV